MLQFNDEAARKLETVYSSADIVAQRKATLERLRLRSGENVIDVGCGPGFLCEQIAECVGPTGRVLGVDVSEDLLAFARGRNTRDWLTYSYEDAMTLSTPDASFDVAVGAQVLEYVEDPDSALAEMYRVLKPGGRALIVDTDWDRVGWVSSNQERMMRVRRAWEEHCAHPRLPQTLVPCLRAAGFKIAEISTFSITNTRLEQGTYSHGLLDLIRDFLLDRGTIEPDELAAWADELRSLSSEGRYFFTTTRCFFGVSKPAETPE